MENQTKTGIRHFWDTYTDKWGIARVRFVREDENGKLFQVTGGVNGQPMKLLPINPCPN